MNKRIPHIHKYKKVIVGLQRKVVKNEDGSRSLVRKKGWEVYKCMQPGCTCYKPRELVVGEYSLCWKCNEPLVMNMENTTLVRPTHKDCREKKTEKRKEVA